MLWKKINSILTREKMLKIAWYSTHVGFWTCWFQWHRFWSCTFRHFWVMGYTYALSWKLLIIGLLLEYYATLLKRLCLKKIAAKCSIFLHQLDFFLMWRSRMHFVFVWIRIKFHLGRAKGRVNGGMRETPNWVFFLQNSHYKVRYKLYLTNCWSDKLLTTTIVISTSKQLNVQTFKWFWAVLPGQKQLCVFFKKQIWPPNRKCYGNIWNVRNTLSLPLESRYISRVPSFLHSQNSMIFPWFEIKLLWKKINSILTREKCSKWLDTPHMLVFWKCWFQWHRFWSCTFRHFWVMGYM